MAMETTTAGRLKAAKVHLKLPPCWPKQMHIKSERQIEDPNLENTSVYQSMQPRHAGDGGAAHRE